jgi:hypothetical protein
MEEGLGLEPTWWPGSSARSNFELTRHTVPSVRPKSGRGKIDIVQSIEIDFNESPDGVVKEKVPTTATKD